MKIKKIASNITKQAFKTVDVLEKPSVFALSVIVFVALNILIRQVPIRYDASQNSAYTLSQSSKKIIKSLDDIVTIKFFVSSDVPTRLLPLKTDVVDFLKEYERYNGKIVVKIMDPKVDKEAMSDAEDYGIPPLQFSEIAAERNYTGAG